MHDTMPTPSLEQRLADVQSQIQRAAKLQREQRQAQRNRSTYTQLELRQLARAIVVLGGGRQEPLRVFAERFKQDFRAVWQREEAWVHRVSLDDLEAEWNKWHTCTTKVGRATLDLVLDQTLVQWVQEVNTGAAHAPTYAELAERRQHATTTLSTLPLRDLQSIKATQQWSRRFLNRTVLRRGTIDVKPNVSPEFLRHQVLVDPG